MSSNAYAVLTPCRSDVRLPSAVDTGSMARQQPILAQLINRFPAVKLFLGAVYGMLRRFMQTGPGSFLRSGPPRQVP